MKYKRKLAAGGTLDYAGLAAMLSQVTDAAGQQENGTQSNTSAAASGALKGAGVGASIGSVVPGIGTAIGAGAGAIVGGVASLARNKKVLEAFSKLKGKEAEGRTRMLNQTEDAKLLNYDRGSEYQTFFKAGGRIGGPVVNPPKDTTRVEPIPLASSILPVSTVSTVPVVSVNSSSKSKSRDRFRERAMGGKIPFQLLNVGAVKVKGKKHEQGGVKLKGGIEVEKGEVIHGDKVYSDRLKIPGTNKTYANEAQRLTERPMYKTLGRKIRGLEKGDSNLKMNMYQSGTMVRNLQKSLNPLEALFNLQEVHKVKSGIGDGRKMAYGGSLYDETPIRKGVRLGRNYFRKNKDALVELQQSPEERAVMVRNKTSAAMQKEYDYRANQAALLGTLPPEMQSKTMPNFAGSVVGGATTGGAAGVVDPKVKKNHSFTGKQLLDKAGQLAPYADNLVNAILTQKSPQVPVPTLEVAPTLKTKFNIQPQLGEIARSNNATNRTLRDNVSDGASLRGSLLAQNINNISAKNNLLGQKENVETELLNKQAALNADTANRNASTMNAYDLRKFGRNADQQTRISQNVANLVEDVQQKQIDKKLDINDETNLALVLKKYEKTGVLNRLQINQIMTNVRNGMTAEEAIAEVKNKPTDKYRLPVNKEKR